MGLSSMLRSPKHEEEQQVPDELLEQSHHRQETIDDIMEGLEGFLGIESYDVDVDEDESEERSFIGCWDQLMEWEEFAKEEELGLGHEEQSSNVVVVKSEHNDSVGFWDEVDEDNRLCLNLNLNYQEVMDAWSHRGSLWARHDLSNAYYMGEVPVMEGERSNRREASVLRYKEKRQSRLFSKKIRYQVRKLNADKRPRLKGRFVKRGGSEIR